MIANSVSIEIKNKEIIETGSIIISDKDELTFNIRDLKYTIRFTDDEKNLTTRYNYKQIDKKQAELNFINSKSPTGKGTSKPLNLGNFGDKDLFLYIYMYALRNLNSRLIHYTWFLGAKDE